ncbi:heavy metal transporter [Streptomyces triticagri]|uniref:Heavy metal transporter n=1 Tax=Streptomyces triticagri TaxID=2293568 RepID=A0A372MBY5_9ACTN|nr:heavy metal transporter [Streptomyces triticagri]RFU88401.1 heavy metal transporter [Streptomyces triticagri]
MPAQPSPYRRRGRLLRIGAALVVLVALAGYLAIQYAGGGKRAPRCLVVSGDGDGGTYEFTAEQAVNAATVSAVGTSRGMPERAVTIALATALQESGLRNIDHGDRDSIGLFQQRPSQGWGTEKQIMDPVYSSEKFYEHLAEVPGYSRLPLTVAAQRVQRSGYPQAYAKHEPDAALLAAALTGRAAAAFSCETREAAEPGDPAKVRKALRKAFGADVLSGTEAAGAVASGGQGSDVDEGEQRRTVSVPVADVTAANAESTRDRRGWELAHWAVAHAAELRLERVSYAGREWRAAESGAKWSEAGDGPAAGKGADEAVRIVTAP